MYIYVIVVLMIVTTYWTIYFMYPYLTFLSLLLCLALSILCIYNQIEMSIGFLLK